MSQPSTSQRVVGLGRSGTLLQHSFAHPHLIFALHLPPRPFHHFSLNLVYLCPQRATMHDRAGEEFWNAMDDFQGLMTCCLSTQRAKGS